MWSEFATGDFQWYYNGSILDDVNWIGETGQELYLTDIALDPTYVGTYYCTTGEGQTRNITVTSTVYESPVITSIVNDGSDVTITWETVPGADHYDIYSSTNPYATSVIWIYEGTEYDVKKAAPIVWSEPSPIDNKKFYFVKAIYSGTK